jgi:orotate phosphoribosyltransferase
MVAIFSYELAIAQQNFKESGCPLVTLSNYPALLDKAVETNYISQADLKTLKAWRNDPNNWLK